MKLISNYHFEFQQQTKNSNQTNTRKYTQRLQIMRMWHKHTTASILGAFTIVPLKLFYLQVFDQFKILIYHW